MIGNIIIYLLGISAIITGVCWDIIHEKEDENIWRL